MDIVTYPDIFFVNGKTLYAKYDPNLGWGLYASQAFQPGEIVLKLHINERVECNLQVGPTFGDCFNHGMTIAPNIEWCPTPQHPFWNLNHTCRPTCGLQAWGRLIEGCLILVAYENIPAHTHVAADYSPMTTVDEGGADGRPWTMTDCLCGEATCRQRISEFRLLDEAAKIESLTRGRDEAHYGGVLAHILNEESDFVARLKAHSAAAYSEYVEVLTQQQTLSRQFMQAQKNTAE